MLWFVSFFIRLGALTKRAQLPFSAWLPAAIAAPTPVSSLVHSSTLVTAGVYLIIRFRSFLKTGELSLSLIIISLLTIFISGLGANFEFDLKKIIALSTLSQLGVIIIALSLGFFELAFFHLLTHAIFKAILFLCAGVVIHRARGAQDIRFMGVFLKVSPILAGFIRLSSLSLSGFLFLRGFYSKDLILEISYFLNNSYIFVFLLVTATIFTVSYSLRLGWYVFWAAFRNFSSTNISDSSIILNPILFLGRLVVCLGRVLAWLLFPHPFFFPLRGLVKILNLLLIFLGRMIFFFSLKFKNLKFLRFNFFGSL